MYSAVYSDSSEDEENIYRLKSATVQHLSNNCEAAIVSQPKENDFVVVKISGKKSVQHFVAIVENVGNEECSVLFLKQTGNSKFSPPEEKTFYDVNLMEIVKVLPQPCSFRRNMYTFDFDFSVYNMKY